MNDLQALEDSNNLLKGVTKTIENETKEQKGRLFSMLIGTFGATFLGNVLTGKGIVRAVYGNHSKNKMIFNKASSFKKL